MDTVTVLTQFVAENLFWAHLLIPLGVVAEGDLTLLFGGILAHLGSLNFFAVLGLAYLGAMSKSFLGYGFGYWFKKKYPNHKFLNFVDQRVSYYLPHLREKPFWSIFLSKFLYGFLSINYFVLIYLGFINSNFKKFIRYELLASFAWVLVGVSVGYFFSYTALQITREFRKFMLILVGLIILFFILEKVITFIVEAFETIKHKH